MPVPYSRAVATWRPSRVGTTARPPCMACCTHTAPSGRQHGKGISMAYIYWRGQSTIGEAPIRVLISKAASPSAANSKTGHMWQVYILPDNGLSATDSVASGADRAVCGNCPHRKADGGAGDCYTYGMPIVAANGMIRVDDDGRSETITADMITASGLPVRLGAYGDPAAVPFDVMAPLVIAADKRHTAYTHQWRTCDQRWREVAMASCDSIEDMHEANAMGWRTYTVVPVGTGKIVGAVPCPSPRVKCADCLKCGGTGTGRRGNVSIEAHGARARKFRPTIGVSLPLSVTN